MTETDPWLEGLTPERRVTVIVEALAGCLSAGLAEARQPRREHDERCCLNGVPAGSGPHPDCRGLGGEPAAVPPAEQAEPEPVTHYTTPADSRLVQDNQPACGARRRQLVSPDAGLIGGPGTDSWRDGYQAFVAECAAGKAEPTEEPEPDLDILTAAWTLSRDMTGRGSPEWEQAAEAWRARFAWALAESAAGTAREAEAALPLVPEGTYVHAAIKGFIERDGYLFTGQWLGDPHMVVLRDRDGAFTDVFPRSSVHLISAQPEPGSEPEEPGEPDPWTETIADARAAVLRRNWQRDRDKLIALRTWLESFLEGDAALAEVLAIFERDFRPQEADEEAPF